MYIGWNDSYKWVVEIDLGKFFDRVNHDKLMLILAKKITDKQTLKLLRAYLNCGIMEDGVVIFRDTEGHFTEDTPLNRHILENVANDGDNLLGPDKYGSTWYAKNTAEGK